MAMLTRLLAGLACLAFVVPAWSATKEEEMTKFIKELKDKDAKVRATAAEEIGKLGQTKSSLAKPAIAPLLETLKDKETKVRAAAALALGQCDPEDGEKAVKALTELMNDTKEDDLVRRYAVMGLGAMGEKAKAAVGDMRKVAGEAKEKGNKAMTKVIGENIKLISGMMKKKD
jgi:hypothetical protein